MEREILAKNVKKKERAAMKQTRSKRKAEAKRLLESRQKELESPEAKLLVKFLGEHPEIDVTLQTSETLWTFLRFLKEKGYSLVHGNDIVCVPFSHLVDPSKLK